jgi:hypothetical protein
MFATHVAAAILSHVSVAANWMVQEGGGVRGIRYRYVENHGNWVAKIVVIILFIMSGWSIGVMIDRWMAYNAARKQSRAFARPLPELCAMAASMKPSRSPSATRRAIWPR